MGVYAISIVYLFGFKEKKRDRKKRIQQEKKSKINKIRVDLLIHWIDYLLYEKKLYLEIKRGVELS